MSLVDKFEELDNLNLAFNPESESAETMDDLEGDTLSLWRVTEKDMTFVVPTAQMMLRLENLSPSIPEPVPYNLYSQPPKPLSLAVLDCHTKDAGNYLIKQFLARNNLMDMTLDQVDLQGELFMLHLG